MKAALLHEIQTPIRIEEVPRPAPGTGEVLVRTKACGICGTDVHIWDGWGYVPDLPFVMGHEPSGVVAEVGPGVTRFQAGDRVIPNIFYSCGYCFYCRTDRETQCINLDGILGVLKHPGGYGEYFTVPERQLFHLPDTISFSEGAVIADAVVTAVHAVQRGRVRAGETVVVIGMGGCGSAVAQVCQDYGAEVIGADVSAAKVDWAYSLNVSLAVNTGEVDLPSTARQVTGDLGAHCVIDTVGNKQTLAVGINSLRRGGRLVLLGYTQEQYPLDPRQVAVHELEVIGTRSGGRQCTVEAIRIVSQSTWRPIVTDMFPIDDVNQALQMMREGGALGRIVLVFDGAH